MPCVDSEAGGYCATLRKARTLRSRGVLYAVRRLPREGVEVGVETEALAWAQASPRSRGRQKGAKSEMHLARRSETPFAA